VGRRREGWPLKRELCFTWVNDPRPFHVGDRPVREAMGVVGDPQVKAYLYVVVVR